MRKAKSCYNCIAFNYNNRRCNNGGCLLGYDVTYNSTTDLYSPKECCHKPKTYKEFTRRFNDR